MNNIDPILEEALKNAVKDSGQPPALASRILAWMDELSSGGSDIDDKSEASQRLKLILDSVEIKESTKHEN